MEFRIEEVPDQEVAFIRHVGPYMQVGEVWTQLLGWAQSAGAFNSETKSIGVSYDDPSVVPESELRYDACVTIGEDVDVDEDGPIDLQTIEGGKFGVALHKGHYAGFQDFYKTFTQALEAAGETIRPRACWEIYVNSPMDVGPDDLLTEIYIPIR